MTHDDVRAEERLRISTWLRAKSAETEQLLKLAASRCEGERAAWNKLFAIKTAVIIAVMAEMIDASLVVSTDWLVTEVCRMVLGPPLPTVTESVLDPLLEKTPSVAVNWALAL